MINTIIKRAVLITYVCTFSLSTFSAKLNKEKNFEAIRKSLGAGINISLFEHTWSTADQLLQENIDDKLKKLPKQATQL